MRKPKQKRPASGFALMLGMFFSSILDPKTRITSDLIQKRRDGEKVEAGRENE